MQVYIISVYTLRLYSSSILSMKRTSFFFTFFSCIALIVMLFSIQYTLLTLSLQPLLLPYCRFSDSLECLLMLTQRTLMCTHIHFTKVLVCSHWSHTWDQPNWNQWHAGISDLPTAPYSVLQWGTSGRLREEDSLPYSFSIVSPLVRIESINPN